MAKTGIEKPTPLPHVIVVDTSILWSGNKADIVTPIFDNFWAKYSSEFQLQLVVPDIVRGELEFQHFASGVKAITRANEALKKISEITSRTFTHSATESKIKKHVGQRFDKWLKTLGATVLPIPFDIIDWEVLTKSAVWRLPPFEADEKNPKNEKGFRDALILETLANFVLTDDKKINIVFLSSDGLLRETAEKRLGDDARLSIYESLSEFESYLRLTKEELTNKFIHSILRRASLKFFKEGDSTSLALRDDITAQLGKKYKEYFDDPSRSSKSKIASALMHRAAMSWYPVDKGIFWVQGTQFKEIEDTTKYHWITLIEYRQLYEQEQLGKLGSIGFSGFHSSDKEQHGLYLDFHVFWSASVTSDARFRKITLESVELVNNEYRPPTEDEIELYKWGPERR